MNYSHRYAMKLNSGMIINEEKYNVMLTENKRYVLRFDGVHMTKNFLGKPEFKIPFLQTMSQTLALVMSEHKELKFAYSYSDEISILLEDEVLEKYNYRLEKIISIFTSELSMAFFMSAQQNMLPLGGKLRSFDCRIIELEDINELKKYFISRQAFSISCHLARLRFQYLGADFPDNSDLIINKLLNYGIDYFKINKKERYGIIWANKMLLPAYEFSQATPVLYHQLLGDDTRKYVPYKKR